MAVTASSVTWQGCPPEKLLRECFHILTDFHPGQCEIIEKLVHGRRVLAIQRTGWGKSFKIYTISVWFLLQPCSLRCGYTHEVS